MEGLFTCSPHSITPFTPSQLTLFPTTGYSIHLSHFFFALFSSQRTFSSRISHILLPTGGVQAAVAAASAPEIRHRRGPQ